MSAPDKSFFSGLHGFITGMAAFVTAAVAIFGLAVNQGWLSGSANKPGASHGAAATGTTVGSGGTDPSGTATTAVPEYTVDPSSISYQSFGPTTTSVKVTNTGVVPMTVEAPMVTGSDASRFTAADQTCGSSVDPGRSCQLQVTFKHASGTFNATLVVQVTGAVRATEVPIQASAIL